MGYLDDHYPEDVYELPDEDPFDESPDDPGVSTLLQPESTENNLDREEIELRQKDLYDRCSYILGQLKSGERRWSDDKDEDQSIALLEPYKKEILTETDQRDPHSPSLLHALARKWDQYHIEHPIVRKAAIHIIKGAPKNGEKEAPIWQLAVSHRNLAFIEFIKEYCPDQLPVILAMKDDMGQNFFHYLFYLAIDKSANQQRKETLDRAKEYFPFVTAEILAAQDNRGKNTPIHYALHPQQCLGRGQEYVKLVKDMIQKADKLMEHGAELNESDQSPYQYCLVHSAMRKKKLDPPKAPIARRNDTKQDVKLLKSSSAEESKTHFTPVAANVKVPLGSSKLPPPFISPPIFTGADIRGSTSIDSMHGGPLLGNIMPNASISRVGSMAPPDRGRPVAIMEDDRQRSRPQSSDHHILTNAPGPGPRRAPTNPALVVSQQAATSSDGGRQGTVEAKNQSRKDPEQSMNHLLLHLHLHYIRERPDMVARELIYGKHVSERNLYFDAISLEDKTPGQIVDLISRLSIGGFDKVLSYVRIPSTKLSAPPPDAPKQGLKTYAKRLATAKQEPVLGENPNPGRQSLVSVFDQLYEVGVRRIIRLYVDDMVAPCHTDAAIERAIAGKDALGLEMPRKDKGNCGRIIVETWDWQKPDLSIDVIRHAAPDVQHLVLYWSGNQAILRGWAAEEGIPRLCTPAEKSELKTVTIQAAPGLESTARMKRCFAIFCNSIEQRIKDKSARPTIIPEFQVTGLRCGPSSSLGKAGYLGGDGPLEVVHRDKWMEAMDRFRGALQLVHDSLPETHRRPEKVKVALIDDGVRLDKLSVYFGQMVEASGLSYYPRGKHTEEPWHNSTHGHGTVMANMIARINPWVSLCVIRAHDVPSRDGSHMITPRSAAKAIWAAIGRKVNIISMSWTILSKVKDHISTNSSGESAWKSEEDPELEDLCNAIDKAVKDNILIFCSANDDISLKATDYLPYQRAPKYIFRIGAADQHGRPDNSSEDYNAMNFYLPGNKVAESDNPASTSPIRYHTGASVSTALAAGLASLFIYCASVGQVYYDSIGNRQRAEEFARKRDGLKLRVHMETAFQSIKFPGWNGLKFPPVWGPFGDATTSITGTDDVTVRLEALATLVHGLSSAIR